MKPIALFFLVLTLYGGELSVSQLFNVKTVSVEKSGIVESRRYYGTVEADEGRVHDVALRFDGYIGKVAVDKPYTYVTKGEKLFDIYSPGLFLAAGELLNTLGNSHVELRESILKKLRLLGVDQQVIAKILKSKKVDEYLPVYAPASGYVTQKSVVNGSSVKAGQILYRVTDLTQVWVMARVYESDLDFVKEGMDARINIDGIKESLAAKVDRIYPNVDAKERSVKVRLVVDNPEGRVFPGAFAEIMLSTPEREGLVLPKTAVITKGERHYVFVTGEYEGEYDPALITARRLGDGRFEILSGLAAGQKVVDKALFLFDSDAQLNGLY